ncbi:MAG TPA: DUF1223 domain-containing protein [Burkholderiales bacterium]|nr:DUF1223 domain-containing protein [Burkholderiales bacterium]
MRLFFLPVLLLASASAWGAACSAVSGEKTAALVELYTSEGCDSCPPADRWLSSLGERGYVPGRVVPLSLHVDYWDYIGWKDPYAKPAFSGRQRKLTSLQRLAFVYTPQVMLQGQDFRAWRGPAFDAAVARINAEPARARISLAIDSLGPAAMAVEVAAQVLDKGHFKDAALYVAAYENRLSSAVTSGENRGRTLKHDYVVLEWQGPLDFGTGAARSERRSIPLLPGAVPANSGVVAFVQNRRSLEVLQALMLPACAA